MKADVLITFNGPKNTCDVGIGDAPATPVPFAEVVSYLANDLQLPPGSLFDVTAIPDVDVREYERVMAALGAAGYKVSPGIHVFFLTEPKRRDL